MGSGVRSGEETSERVGRARSAPGSIGCNAVAPLTLGAVGETGAIHVGVDMAGQILIPLVSDPFGFGWGVFGTKNHFVRIGLVDARAVW